MKDGAEAWTHVKALIWEFLVAITLILLLSAFFWVSTRASSVVGLPRGEVEMFHKVHFGTSFVYIVSIGYRGILRLWRTPV